MANIPFVKMQSLGNDFMIIDGINNAINIASLPIQKWANRHTGVGFDQLLLLLPGTNEIEFCCEIYNADGSKAEQCGNGLRCLGRYIILKKLTDKKIFKMKTPIVVELNCEKELIKIDMGAPTFAPEKIPFITDKKAGLIDLALPTEVISNVALVSMGNPHVIIKVDQLSTIDVNKKGRSIAELSAFPKGVNVGFMQILSPYAIQLKTYERGVGETFACGTNACAAAVSGIAYFNLATDVEVKLMLGSLFIHWDKTTNASVFMQGDALLVYEGSINL